MSPRFPLLLMFGLLMHCEAFTSCAEDPRNAISSRSMYFYGVANRILLGHGYLNLTGVSKPQCGKECLSDGRCFSVHYTGGENMCELNGATASRFPLALTERTSTYYYGPEKPQVVEKLLLLVGLPGGRGPPSVTDCTYQTQASASTECQRTDQHLCELWEVKLAYEAGYGATMPHDTSLWYAVPDSQAVLSGSGVIQHGLPVSVPSPGICCLGPQLNPQNPVITTETYANGDRDGMGNGCSVHAAHLCTLPELKAAYLRGYRQPYLTWPCFAMPSRDAQLFQDGCDVYSGGAECYEEIVANTPRPSSSCNVFCCKNLY